MQTVFIGLAVLAAFVYLTWRFWHGLHEENSCANCPGCTGDKKMTGCSCCAAATRSHKQKLSE